MLIGGRTRRRKRLLSKIRAIEMVDGRGQVKANFRASNLRHVGQVNTEHPTSRRRGLGCSRIYGHIIRDVKLELLYADKMVVIVFIRKSSSIGLKRLTLSSYPNQNITSSIILVLLSTNQRWQSELSLGAFQGSQGVV